jgi:hypothetical protein
MQPLASISFALPEGTLPLIFGYPPVLDSDIRFVPRYARPIHDGASPDNQIVFCHLIISFFVADSGFLLIRR